MPKRGLAFVLVFLCVGVFSPQSEATHEEIVWGSYSYKSDSLSIQFRWDINGISNLNVNGHSYTRSQVSYTYSGDPGSCVIRIQENDTDAGLMRLVFLLRGQSVLFVSGYYAELSNVSEDGQFNLKSVRTIEMKFAPLSAGS